ncbi:hypothetical protein H5410_020051 [Solanum commersonii]|uniref:Vps72/YL1 C-terminal domain-containing protein n=1 Tax=Solanum commersonii TaxID=4109 RepID=A0A9J5Z7Z9_SOLCO|nr:hypothetical protein H5410_020051 [Solanum commersonii]
MADSTLLKYFQMFIDWPLMIIDWFHLYRPPEGSVCGYWVARTKAPGWCTIFTKYKSSNSVLIRICQFSRYRDPKTGLPYATKEAFKIIRERFSEESSRAREEKHMDELSQAISGLGFTSKRKRSIISNSRKTSYTPRVFAHCHKFPADDSMSEDSE